MCTSWSFPKKEGLRLGSFLAGITQLETVTQQSEVPRVSNTFILFDNFQCLAGNQVLLPCICSCLALTGVWRICPNIGDRSVALWISRDLIILVLIGCWLFGLHTHTVDPPEIWFKQDGWIIWYIGLRWRHHSQHSQHPEAYERILLHSLGIEYENFLTKTLWKYKEEKGRSYLLACCLVWAAVIS